MPKRKKPVRQKPKAEKPKPARPERDWPTQRAIEELFPKPVIDTVHHDLNRPSDRSIPES